jgi:probable HAF family extracellular repeat protein
VTDLGTLGGASSTVAAPGDPRGRGALNERGDVVGVSDTAAGQRHGFLWRDGRMVDLGTLGGSSATPMAVNERRQVVGSSTRADGTFQAFAWQGGA